MGLTLDEVIDRAANWRTGRKIDDAITLSPEQTIAFATDLQAWVKEVSVRPERVSGVTYDVDAPQEWDSDAMVIPYAGGAGGVASWKHAKAMSEHGDGKLCYISDTPAGQLLNSEVLQDAVALAVGGKNNWKYGEEVAKVIFQGSTDNGIRSQHGVGNVMAINDTVSEKLMLEMAAGDVRTITHDAPDHSVFVQTELPALLRAPKVTAINGIPIETLRELHERTGSIIQVNAVVAEASRRLMEGTSFTMTAADGSDGKTPNQVASIDGTRLFAGSGVAGPVFNANGAPVKVMTAPQIALLTIEKMDTAAFQGLGRNLELSNVLTDAAHKIESGTQASFALQDTNGNDVGRFEIVASAPREAPVPGTARLQFDLSQPEFQADRAGQLSQSILVAADQIVAQNCSDRIVVASPEGKSIGTLDVAAPAASGDAAPDAARHYETHSL